MSTPHISAERGEIAESILLPGDPLRAKFIAENFLDNVKRFNAVRNMYGYTGFWNGEKISVMVTGMGCPSMMLYAEELCQFYDVNRLFRIGSCGSIQKDLKLKDIVIAQSAYTDAGGPFHRFRGGTFAPSADFHLTRKTWETAESKSLRTRVGSILTSDIFYSTDMDLSWKDWASYGILAIDMEAAGLYLIAARNRVKALSLMTVSDEIISGEKLSTMERQNSFEEMIVLVMDSIRDITAEVRGDKNSAVG